MTAFLRHLSAQALLMAVFVSEGLAEAENLLEGTSVLDPELNTEPLTEAGYEAVHGEAAAKGASEAGLPQLDPEWFASQIFWLLLTFGGLYMIFSRKILPELSNIIENRHEHIQDDLVKAQELKEEAEKVQAAYEEAVAEAHEKASELFAKAEDNIKEKTAAKNAEFREKSMKDIQAAEKKFDKAKTKAMDEMETIAAEIASQAAEKIVGISTDVKAAKSVIENMNKKAA